MVRRAREADARYVRLGSSGVIRKDVLETAVDATNLLKRWESYKRIKEKKLIYAGKLRLLMRKIHNEIAEFRRHFPDVKEEAIKVPKVRRVSEIEKTIIKGKNDLDRELDSIKAKLERLGV